MNRWITVFLTLTCGVAEAKVFSFSDNNVAAYIRGGAGMSRLHQDAFGNSSGVGDLSGGNVAYNFSGEIGFQYSLGALAIRLGVEALRPKELESTGRNSSGTDLFTVTSSVFTYSPMITFEYVYSMMDSTRFYGFLGGGYSTVSFDNKYVLTPAGYAILNPLFSVGQTYTEKGTTTAIPISAGMGFETMFNDNVTFSLDAGYRYLIAKKFKHQAAGPIIGGTVAKGDPVVNMDGSDRVLDLGGLMINATFRFYINF